MLVNRLRLIAHPAGFQCPRGWVADFYMILDWRWCDLAKLSLGLCYSGKLIILIF